VPQRSTRSRPRWSGSLASPSGSAPYQYDRLGRLTQVAAPNGTLTYAWDVDGNRTTLGYPGNVAVTYAYSPGGRLTQTNDWAARTAALAYQPPGLISTVNYPKSGYDSSRRPGEPSAILPLLADVVRASKVYACFCTPSTGCRRWVMERWAVGRAGANARQPAAAGSDQSLRLG
jgi:hypothetical protein